MSAMKRWFWMRLLHMAPRDIVDLHGHVQSLDDKLWHLHDCVRQALTQCEQHEDAPERPEIVLDEEWSK